MKRNTIAAFAAGALFALILFFAGVLSAQQAVRIAQVGTTGTDIGNGTTGSGTLRVTISNDSTGQIALAAGSATIGTVTCAQATAASLNATVTGTAVESTDSTEQGHPRVPAADGTAIQLSCTTSTSTQTVTDGVTYRMGITGASAQVIWGGTAALTTGFSMPEGLVEYQRAEGASVACLTAAGTGTLTLTPATFDD